jgi:hypothetical protein
VSARASSRIAHRVAAADKDGERRGEMKMKKGKERKVAAIRIAPETSSKSLRQVLYEARENSEEKIDELNSILESYLNRKEAVPKVLLSIAFLMDWCTDGINEELSGPVSSGLGHIARRCAYETAARYAEHEELLGHSDLQQKIQSSSKPDDEVNSQKAS